jgi:hypothetical protein
MVVVKQVNLSLFPQFYPLLKELNPQLSEAEWYRVFDHHWHQEEKFCGYGLFDEEEIVGFLGLIFSQRIINGRREDFCNLSSWIVRKPYRGHSISLMLSLRKLKNCTITDLSPTEGVVAIFKKLGFQKLDRQIEILPNIFSSIGSQQKLTITTDISVIQSRLTSAEQKLLQDHQSYSRCHHLLAEAEGQTCYLIFTLVKNAKVPYSYIQYLGNPKLFARYSLGLRRAIAKVSQTFLVLVDTRLLQGAKLPLRFNLPIEICRLYKSSTVKPEEIDNLYSELIMLDFSPIPSLTWRKVVKQFKKTILPNK